MPQEDGCWDLLEKPGKGLAVILWLVPTSPGARKGSHILITCSHTLPGRPSIDLSFPGIHSSRTDPQSTVTREDLESGCNHAGRGEHILKRNICASPFGYQIIETIVPKEMEFP